jgi:hypothetical protein
VWHEGDAIGVPFAGTVDATATGFGRKGTGRPLRSALAWAMAAIGARSSKAPPARMKREILSSMVTSFLMMQSW